MSDFSQHLQSLRQRIQAACLTCGRDPASVSLLAVSKTQPAPRLREALACGLNAFGENYLQEALEKQAELVGDAIDWHFIGQIQSNKTRAIAEHFSWAHGIDSEKIARRLSEQRPAHLPPLQVCLQVNVDGEASKGGVTPADLPALAATVAGLPRLRLRGLMAIPAPSDNAAVRRQAFRRVADGLHTLRLHHPELDTLSMGMSADLEDAIVEGSTLIRVGTALFGTRPPKTVTASMS